MLRDMPRYVIERLFDQKVEKLTPATSQKSLRLIRDEYPSLVWEHSHVAASTEDGLVRTFCIYTAPDPQTILAHAASVGGHVVLNVYEIAGDVAPADVPPVGTPAPPSFWDSSGGGGDATRL